MSISKNGNENKKTCIQKRQNRADENYLPTNLMNMFEIHRMC